MHLIFQHQQKTGKSWVLKVRPSPFKNVFFYLLQRKPFTNDEKRFLFCLKSFFRSSDIEVFVVTFLVTWENGLIRKLTLFSKFITLQPGKQTITIHILVNISRSKGNQIMRFGQLIEYNVRNIFFQNSWRKWGREASCRPLFVF